MFPKATRAALVLSLALPALAAAQSFEYAPTASQYRVTQKSKGTQDMMGQKQEFESSSTQVLSVTIARNAKDTMDVLLVLDSIAAVTPMGPPPGLDKMMGLKVNAKLSPAGVVYSTALAKADSAPSAASIAESMGSFLPKIRAKLATGATWTDTTSGRVKQMGLDLDRKVVSKYTVVGDTTVAGEKNWKIAKETNTIISGSGTSNGQAMTMEGTTSGKSALLVSQKGVFFGGEGNEDSTIKVIIATTGMEIGVTTVTSTKVEKIK